MGHLFYGFRNKCLFSFFLAGIWTKLYAVYKNLQEIEKISLYTWIYEKICVPVAGNMNGSLMFALFRCC